MTRNCIALGCGAPCSGLYCEGCRTSARTPMQRKRLAKKTQRVPVLSEARWEGDALVVVLPIPHRTLHPNGRLRDERVKAKRVKSHREAARRIVEAQGRKPLWTRGETQVVLYAPDAQRRDADGLAASLKAYWDGIADAGVVVNDSGLRHLPPRMDIDRVRPRVELTLTPLEDR